jgi:dipeptidyl-peptidase-4
VESFPRQRARTRGFRLGAPRAFTITDDGVVFLRSRSGTDPVTCLWVWRDGAETVLADPLVLGDLAEGDSALPDAERARRERMREVTEGITAYSTDRAAQRFAFAVGGVPYVADITTGDVTEMPAPGPVVDPRIDPGGTRVAYVHDGSVWVATVDDAVRLTAPDSDTVTWGLADFIASEELNRMRGLWWLADGEALIVERVDEAPVQTWWISDPARPEAEPRAHRYPRAGTANADVSLWLVHLDGDRTRIAWDSAEFPYLATVTVGAVGDPLITLLSRDQRSQRILAVNRAGQPRVIDDRSDPAWVDVVPGVPRWDASGHVLDVVADEVNDTYRLTRDGQPVTPVGFQVAGVADVEADGIVVTGGDDPTRAQAYLLGADSSLRPLVPDAGVCTATRSGDVVVTTSMDLDTTASLSQVWRGGLLIGEIANVSEKPVVHPRVAMHVIGERSLRTAVIFPTDHVPGTRRLPVLLSPYGGPHARMTLRSGIAFGTAQWLADHGFCVVVADGRGTPGRGPAWERAVRGDLAGPVLDDQVAALDAVLEKYPDDTDADRVGIRGWSFGGYLAALAVLRRPDRFHAAVAGAPVTEWRLYDTAYTERYLGDPAAEPTNYERSSLLPLATDLRRPLLLVHGLADDNVVVAHTLQLSSALLAAGCPHSVLPLSGVTHMTPQEVIAENLLRAELDFFSKNLSA